MSVVYVFGVLNVHRHGFGRTWIFCAYVWRALLLDLQIFLSQVSHLTGLDDRM